MCYHYALRANASTIVNFTGADWDEAFEPVFHASGFTFPAMPVLTVEAPQRIQRFYWGLIPHWVPSLAGAQKIRMQTLNARSETLFEKPAFRSYTKNRCVVLADGFFEWMEWRRKKYPHFIQLEEGALFGFAGLYAHWTDKETGELITGFTIITTEANPLLARIHNNGKRMPVILRKADWQAWLRPNLSNEAFKALLQPAGDHDMKAHTISKLITTRGATTNVPEIADVFHYPELAPA